MIHMLLLEIPQSGSVEELRSDVRRLFTPWIAYSSAEGRVPFFRRLLLRPGEGAGGTYVTGLRSGFRTATPWDWEHWRQTLLGGGRAVDSLMELSDQFGVPPPALWIMLPYPTAAQAPDQRQKALEEWIDGLATVWKWRFSTLGMSLEGLVWGREGIPVGDLALALSCSQRAKAYGLQTLWLANFGGSGLAERSALSFDNIALFSNYTGAGPYGERWLHDAMSYAMHNRIGWQAAYGRGDRFRKGQETEHLEAAAAYARGGGAGPIVHRLQGLSPERLMQTHPGVYEGIYRVTKGGS